MLPNHAPYVIAEQFGTLATLFPNRIDLGLGRAPGTDRLTMRALRRHLAGDRNIADEVAGVFKEAADRLQRWTRELLLTRDARDLPLVVVRELSALFLVPQVAIKVWGVASEFAGEDYAQGVSDGAASFAHALSLPYCGANTGLEAAQWVVDPASVASIALIPLRAGIAPQAFGLLVLASADPGRFSADMGTDFLQRIGELSSAALSRLRPVG